MDAFFTPFLLLTRKLKVGRILVDEETILIKGV